MLKKFLWLWILAIIPSLAFAETDFYQKLAESAYSLTRQFVIYNSKYYRMDYPGGDVPAHRGVCTDVIIRTIAIQRIIKAKLFFLLETKL